MSCSTRRKMTTSSSFPARFAAARNILLSSHERITNGSDHQNDPKIELSDEFAVSFADTVFGFLHQGQEVKSVSSSGDSGEYGEGYRESRDIVVDEELEGDGGALASVEENKAFWENKIELLQETVGNMSCAERKIGKAAKEALKEVQKEGKFCICRTPVAKGSCRRCLMREIAIRLRNAGYDSAVCKTKWRSSSEMASGEHTFLDVILSSNDKKEAVRVILELSFRAEFVVARSSEEYKDLVARLPEAFIGKPERLRTLIEILCSAAKKCMKGNKMHMGPWRKHNYMQAKWFSSSCQRMEPATVPLTQLPSVQELMIPRQVPVKPRASSNSMLTAALLNLMPKGTYHNVQVAVV